MNLRIHDNDYFNAFGGSPCDWLSPQNPDLWQEADGTIINNVCPAGWGCQQIKYLIKNVKDGTIKMQPELLPRRLNCLWRAAAATAVVGSSVSTPAASIGQVMFIVPVCTTCTSI